MIAVRTAAMTTVFRIARIEIVIGIVTGGMMTGIVIRDHVVAGPISTIVGVVATTTIGGGTMMIAVVAGRSKTESTAQTSVGAMVGPCVASTSSTDAHMAINADSFMSTQIKTEISCIVKVMALVCLCTLGHA